MTIEKYVISAKAGIHEFIYLHRINRSKKRGPDKGASLFRLRF